MVPISVLNFLRKFSPDSSDLYWVKIRYCDILLECFEREANVENKFARLNVDLGLSRCFKLYHYGYSFSLESRSAYTTDQDKDAKRSALI